MGSAEAELTAALLRNNTDALQAVAGELGGLKESVSATTDQARRTGAAVHTMREAVERLETRIDGIESREDERHTAILLRLDKIDEQFATAEANKEKWLDRLWSGVTQLPDKIVAGLKRYWPLLVSAGIVGGGGTGIAMNWRGCIATALDLQPPAAHPDAPVTDTAMMDLGTLDDEFAVPTTEPQ